MNTLTAQQQAVLQAEARRRVRLALAKIEEAQGLIGDACATLSTLRHAAPEWRATGALYDKIKAHWYRVRDGLEFSKKASRIALDPLASETLLQRLAAQPEVHA
jgi:hypothetical protein